MLHCVNYYLIEKPFNFFGAFYGLSWGEKSKRWFKESLDSSELPQIAMGIIHEESIRYISCNQHFLMCCIRDMYSGEDPREKENAVSMFKSLVTRTRQELHKVFSFESFIDLCEIVNMMEIDSGSITSHMEFRKVGKLALERPAPLISLGVLTFELSNMGVSSRKMKELYEGAEVGEMVRDKAARRIAQILISGAGKGEFPSEAAAVLEEAIEAAESDDQNTQKAQRPKPLL